jgi:PAS domain S-box-containing protein
VTAADDEEPVQFPGVSAPQAADPERFRRPSSVMMGVWDFDGYTVSINSTYQAVLGWSVAELSSVPYWELLHPDDRDQSVDVRQRMLLSGPGSVAGHQLRMLRRDGTYRRIRWEIRSDPADQRMHLAGVDISDHLPIVTGKRVLVGSWDWHLPTDTLTLSDGMFEIYGLVPAPAWRLETAFAALYVGDRAAVQRAIRRSIASFEPYTADHRIVHPKHRIRWLHSAGRVFLGENGDAQRLRGLTWDITERPGSHVPG